MILDIGLCQNTVAAWRIIGFVIMIIKIVVPIIIIVTSVIPVFIALTKGTADETIKSWKQIGRKIAAAIIIFYVPYLMSSAVNLFTNAKEDDDVYICTACFNEPGGDECNEFLVRLKDIELSEIEKFEEESIQGDMSTDELNNASYSPSSGGLGANSVSDKTSYQNLTLNVEKAVNTNVNNPDSGLGDGRNRFRAVQAAAYTGKYVVYAQNKNYGSIESSSKGGRICWSDLQTGQQVKCVDVGAEGGHMDGLAYDADRGYVLKTASGNKLMLFDNNTMQFVGYSNIPSTHVGITYVPKIHMLVGEEDGKLIFYKYNKDSNTYVKDHTVSLEGYDANAVQGIGTDGTNIFIADSSPWDSKRNLYTYSLDGKKLETHSFGSGFGSMSSEVESAFADNNGVLYLACPQGIARVTNYTANKIGLRS